MIMEAFGFTLVASAAMILATISVKMVVWLLRHVRDRSNIWMAVEEILGAAPKIALWSSLGAILFVAGIVLAS